MNSNLTLNTIWDSTSIPTGDQYWWYPPNYYPIIEKHYITHWGYWTSEPNKTEKAFKVLQKLVDSKRINFATVKDFIEAVNEIVEVL